MHRKGVPKYVLLETPSLTEWPLGQLKSTIVFLTSDLDLRRVIKCEICILKGG